MVPSKGSAGPFCSQCPRARKMNLLLPSFSEQHSESAFLGLVSWSILPQQSCVSSLMQCVNSRQSSCLVAPRRPCFARGTYILGDDAKKKKKENLIPKSRPMLGEKTTSALKKNKFRLAHILCRKHQVSTLWNSNKTIFPSRNLF